MTVHRPQETEAERADRNFGELLQELRVAQTGVQILFAFLLTIPFQSRFEELDEYQRDVLIAALLFSVCAVACLIAPVAFHRAVFRMRMKDELVRVAARFAIGGLAFLGLAVIAAVHLVLDVIIDRTVAALIVGVLGAGLALIWLVLPLAARLRADPDKVKVHR